ncbi:hypothetical protein PRIPAC_86560 [Pristionchus pacificus]|uniref:Uncharacterized protein n=1 Tax=Pristionchus pacificus TaxID=54126 RepID=A0A2A6BI86_PRIPA|nr:hypothetical protein PRIPAC_86560 [Pristionchus pacificus]|eukprot:PDM65635.1 hypothetical protein PRIPAC_53643 [Pristionchus pacificus]
MVKDPLTGNDDLSSGIAILERSGSSPRRSSLKEQVAVAYCALKKDREILTSESMAESLLAYELKDRVLTGSDSGLLGQDQMKVKKEHGWPTSTSCDALRRTDNRSPSCRDVPAVSGQHRDEPIPVVPSLQQLCKQLEDYQEKFKKPEEKK